MKRARATAVALVNWRGVFFERYLLDRHVTALEGANAAGKTTVLIAAYLVLLPDMSRLRFANVGEQGAGGGDRGVWGRLGETGRPSYAALEVRLADGARLLAGVHLERRGEPAVDATPFIATGLPDEVGLSEVLLERGELDAVPELTGLREHVARAGGRLSTFTTLKDYFAALFDHGVTPLRLATELERGKLNEMLRTSMTGGVSRSLTSGLRGFLFKEEAGLATTLAQMRGNLDACRRTRDEVSESRRLEEEISGVYQAGSLMFAAALHATRERADETRRRVDEARAAVETAAAAIAELERDRGRIAAHHDEARRRHEQATAERAVAARHRELVERGREALGRLAETEAARVANAAREAELRAAREQAEATLRARRDAFDAAFDEQRRAARGLAELQRGIEELHRRAAEHRVARRRLAEARERLPEHDAALARLEPVDGGGSGEPPAAHHDPLDAIAADVDRRTGEATAELVAVERTLSTAEASRREHGLVLAALEAIALQPIAVSDALARARATLAGLRDADALAAERDALPARIETTRARAERQRRVREEAARLEREAAAPAGGLATRDGDDDAGAPAEPLTSADALARAHAAAGDARDAAEAGRQSSERAALAEEAAATAARERAAALERRLARWEAARERAAPLEAASGRELRTRADVAGLRSVLGGDRDEARHAEAELEASIAGWRDEARDLERSGGTFSTELLRARDAVDGQLLAARFEDVPIEEAATLQALLGPLADAIVVDDPRVAAGELAATDDRPDTVWLVGGEAALPGAGEGEGDGERPAGETVGAAGDVLVTGSAGWRLTRPPDQPTLGRGARERRVEELRRRATEAAPELAARRARRTEVEAALEVTDTLLGEADVLERGDPTEELAAARADERDRRARAAKHRGAEAEHAAAAERAGGRAVALRRLLPDAGLLDEPDLDAAVEALRERLRAARAAADRVGRVAADRALLEERLDVLRDAPPSDEELARHRARRDALDREQARLVAGRLALRELIANAGALGWTDAEPALRAQSELVSALELQVERAEAAADGAARERAAAEERHEEAVVAHQGARGELEAIEARLAREREEWERLDLDDASDAAVEAAAGRLAAAEQAEATSAGEARAAADDLVRIDERAARAADAHAAAAEHLEREERLHAPENDRWERLRGLAEQADVLGPALAPATVEALVEKGSANLRSAAKAHGARLLERIVHARDGEALHGRLREQLHDEELSGEDYLAAWLAARAWLRRRVPAQVAETDEPLRALERLREHLRGLEERLSRQEAELRGESEDVARNIDIHIRRAQKLVRRLNDDLEQVRFGSIVGLRIRFAREERMDAILRALREGAIQQMLFQPDVPIEDALDELFRRHGGRTSGQRLLDYREYVDPKVEVRRRVGNAWEAANPTRLSTGEAIGVGAALMMVVLTAWERDANLLRGKRAHGTLRLLFLDEANRLSRDNLAVLFDLCCSLDLQLMIAAPEVAHAEGNTTYHLTRRLDEQGREEVIVSGRRLVAERGP